jgi:hypothetical protein
MKRPTRIILLTVLLLVGRFAYGQEDTLIGDCLYKKIYQISYNGLKEIWKRKNIKIDETYEATKHHNFVLQLKNYSAKNPSYYIELSDYYPIYHSYIFTQPIFEFVNSHFVNVDELKLFSIDYEDYQPCYEIYYNTNGDISSESLQYTDCPIGTYIEYQLNGKRYKKENWVELENPIGGCSVKDGEWNWYNENGEITFTEIWDKGRFVSESPERDTNYIASIDLTLNEKFLNNYDTIRKEDIKYLKIVPHYKNHSNKMLKDSCSIDIYRYCLNEQMSERITLYRKGSFKNVSFEKLEGINQDGLDCKSLTKLWISIVNEPYYQLIESGFCIFVK